MSTRADMSAALQDPDSRAVRSTRTVSIALIGPHIGRRAVVAKAVSSAEGRTVREFATYPDKVTELPRLLAQNFDVVMIDLDSDQNYALQLVQEITTTSSVNVIVYSSRNDPTLGMISSNAGASDFLPIPSGEEEEDRPGPQPVPGRAPAPRPVEVRPETRVSSSAQLNESNDLPWRQPPSAARTGTQQPVTNRQNVAPVRPAPPAPVRIPESAPRPAIDPAWRTVPTQNPTQSTVPNSVQSPVQRPAAQVSVQSVPRPIPSPVQSAAPVPAQTAAQSPVQIPVQRPVERSAAAPVQSSVPVSPAPQPEKPVAQVAAPPATGGIQSDADVLELFRYGKGEVKNIKDPDELPTQSSNKWLFVSAGSIAVIAVVLFFVFQRPSHPKAPVSQPEPEAVSSQSGSQTVTATSPATSEGSTAPATGQPISKPSPAGTLEGAAVPDTTVRPGRQVSSAMMDAQLSAKAKISRDVLKNGPPEELPAGLPSVSMESGGGVKDASLGGFSKVNVVPVVSQVSAGVAEGMAIHKTPPIYPKIARDSHVSGTVVLGATINRSGMLENVHVISGSQMLRTAAVDAVRTWRYRPYMLNSQPVAVQTTINVVFSLGRD